MRRAARLLTASVESPSPRAPRAAASPRPSPSSSVQNRCGPGRRRGRARRAATRPAAAATVARPAAAATPRRCSARAGRGAALRRQGARNRALRRRRPCGAAGAGAPAPRGQPSPRWAGRERALARLRAFYRDARVRLRMFIDGGSLTGWVRTVETRYPREVVALVDAVMGRARRVTGAAWGCAPTRNTSCSKSAGGRRLPCRLGRSKKIRSAMMVPPARARR